MIFTKYGRVIYRRSFMTAEIVIMNKSAIAMAADSAVTFQMNIKGEVKQKIYNTSNKLFMLSKYYPIGILIYGNAEIHGSPWEIIIKEYRKILGSRNFDDVKSYAHDFIEYLNNYFPEEEQSNVFKSSVASFFSSIVLNNINQRVELITSQKGKIELDELKNVVDEVINNEHCNIVSRKELDGIPENYCSSLLKKYSKEMNEAIKAVFVNLPLSTTSRRYLRIIGGNVFCKDVFSKNSSGVVVAGFGEKEKYPSLFAMDVDDVVNDHLKYIVRHDSHISLEESAAIIPFAQQEMVVTFIEGVDPDFSKLLDGYLTRVFIEYPNLLLESLPELVDEKKKILLQIMQKQGTDIQSKLQTSLNEFKEKNNINQIMSVVDYLPKDELAAMAESLVNLTSFKRRISLDAETVGGPIDVAVISKGDGFVWIKRKQYFDANINPHFTANYYRECK